MRRVLRIGIRVLGGLLVIVVILAIFALGSASIPDHSDYQLDLATLRQTADQTKGGQPTRLNAAVVAEANPPAAFFLGGIRFDRHRLVFPAYQIVYAGGGIIVDAPPGRAYFANFFPGAFYDEQFDAVQHALTRARAIVITHEHQDHLQGIAESPHLADFATHLVLSREQRDDEKWLTAAKFPETVRNSLKPIDYDHYYPLAPGVVLIKAPGHTVGSQLVYVRLADHSEFLLVGDVAWDMEQISIPRCRPRGVEWMMGENSAQVTAELRALHDFAQANSSVHLVVSHDANQLASYQDAGLIGKTFQ